MKLFKKYKKVKIYTIHPQIQKWMCQYVVWKDNGICYFNCLIYNNCKKCPYKVIK